MGCSNSQEQVVEAHMDAKNRGEVQVKINSKSLKNCYILGQQIGKGNFGRVFQAKNAADPTSEVAIKVLDKKDLDADDLSSIQTEIGIMLTVDHPNIVKYLETYSDKNHFYLVMEKCSGGNLFDSREKPLKNGKRFTEDQCAEISYKILKTLNHMHGLMITHRDIKPENIMFDAHKEIKVVDFGLSKQTKKLMHQKAGTPYFMSPDVIKGSYGPKCDIWSLGCVLYMMIAGELPFTGSTREEVFGKIKSGVYQEPQKCSNDCKDLISQMLQVEDSKRYSAAQALSHPWFKNLKFQEQNSLSVSQEIVSRMRAFQGKSALHKTALAYLVKIIDSAEVKYLRDEFERLDSDQSGWLDLSEVKQACQQTQIKISDGELNLLMAGIDNNSNRQINYTEFIAATMDLDKLMTDEKLNALYNCFDVDKNRHITYTNIQDGFTKFGRSLTQEEVKQIFNKHDINDNQTIEFEEFKIMMKQLRDGTN